MSFNLVHLLFMSFNCHPSTRCLICSHFIHVIYSHVIHVIYSHIIHVVQFFCTHIGLCTLNLHLLCSSVLIVFCSSVRACMLCILCTGKKWHVLPRCRGIACSYLPCTYLVRDTLHDALLGIMHVCMTRMVPSYTCTSGNVKFPCQLCQFEGNDDPIRVPGSFLSKIYSTIVCLWFCCKT